MGSIEEGVAVAEEPAEGVEDTVYVAVGNNAEKSEQLLHWAAQNFSRKKICILHIHRPEPVNSLNTNRSGYEPKDHSIKAFQEHGIQSVHELLDQYILTLVPAGVQASKLLIEKDNIGQGIIEAIAQHNIRWLVMGAGAAAAADRHKLGCQFQTSVAFNLILSLIKLGLDDIHRHVGISLLNFLWHRFC